MVPAMKLYTSLTSPYGRLARIVMHEKDLQDRVQVTPAQTRQPDSPYYAINPTGRIPCLICDDGTMLEESQLICRYFDHLDGAPELEHPADPEGWETRRVEALARSLLDGVSVWLREMKRPEDERSPTIIAHERARADRLIRLWDADTEQPHMQGPLTMTQITLICALDLDRRIPDFEWRGACPALSAWADKLSERASIAETRPPV